MDSSSFPMANAIKIMRKSIFTFLQNFHFFTSTPSLLVLPFTLTTLVSRSLITSSSLFPSLHARFSSILLSAGIPPQSHLFPILNLKLSQTTLSFLFLFPFTISSLLLSKASTIRILHHHKLPFISLLYRLLITHLCNSLFILSANATCLCLLAITFNWSHTLGLSSPRFLLLLSATGMIFYSIILTNAYIICNISLIASGIHNRSGFNSILRACILIQGRSATALSLALPINMGLAGMEALFETRVVRAYHLAMAPDFSVVLEAMLIAYLYALLLVLDTIVSFVLLKSCKLPEYHVDQEVLYSHNIEIQQRDDISFENLKAFESSAL